MAVDVFKPAGLTQAAKPDAGGAPVRNVPVFGIVKDNIDPNKAGRIFVYISDNSGKDPDSRDSWTPVSLLTPFYGRTTPSGADTGYGKYVENPSSYGEWHSPPDIGTTVICFFVNGDMNYGFYIGAIPEAEALQMVPAIGATENIVANSGEANGYGGATRLPVTNINTNNSGVADSPLYLDEAKPVHSYAAAIFNEQGLIRDPIRGPISSSAQRESPSRVGWGVSTPGRPIYEGGYTDETVADAVLQGKAAQGLKVIARRGGHTFVMDDGDSIGRDQLVRLRTALGHQILMSDDGQTLFIIHSNGQSYIELGKEGTVDIYSTNSINMRTQGDFNIHADRNVNINAVKELKLKAENIIVDSEKDYSHRVGQNYQLFVLGKMTTKVNNAMSFQSQSDASFASTNITYINGSKVNLNTGATGTVPKEVEPIVIQAHTDTLYDSERGFLAAPGKLLSITTRAPAHTPWANAGQGVDVKVDLTSGGNLPSAPAPAIENTNAQAQTATIPPLSVPQASTVPATEPVSESLDVNSTGGVLGAMAQDAGTGAGSLAVQTGSAVVSENGSQVAKIGTFAQSPLQMEQAGVIKPGSAVVVNRLVATGMPIDRAMSSNMFTGKAGAENINSYIKNPAAQARTQVANMQRAQSSLTRAGVITGKESPTQLAGLVLSTVKTGLAATSSVIKSLGPITGSTGRNNNANSNVLKAIATGNNAVNVVQNVAGAFGSISKSIDALGKAQGLGGALNAAKGISGSAFSAIRNSMRPFTPGVPQNLKALQAVNQAQSTVSGFLNTATNLNSLVSAATRPAGGRSSSASVLASGIGNMPGGIRSLGAVVNRAPGAVNTVPGLGSLTSLITNAVTGAFNKTSSPRIPTGANGLLNAVTAGMGAGSVSQLTATISSLASGGPQGIKLPTVGFNTVDRSAITAQTTSLLGDRRIPTPNLSGSVSDSAVSSLERSVAEAKALSEQANRLNDLNKGVAAARQEYQNLKATLPPGDPAIEAAKQKWFAALDDPERQAILSKIG